jgi:hypothetical protein
MRMHIANSGDVLIKEGASFICKMLKKLGLF